jgi:hypothetical protein
MRRGIMGYGPGHEEKLRWRMLFSFVLMGYGAANDF